MSAKEFIRQRHEEKKNLRAANMKREAEEKAELEILEDLEYERSDSDANATEEVK
jgi:hypothetical protein